MTRKSKGRLVEPDVFVPPERTVQKEEDLFEVLAPVHHATVRRWLDRGDGVAVYRNRAFDSSAFGCRKFVSYGSGQAQLETDDPPQRLPDIGGSINWPYLLEAGVRRPAP